jgi:hypothetical protein
MKFTKTIYLIICSIIFCFGITGVSYGEEKSTDVFVGKTKIVIKVPPDFFEVPRNSLPELWKIAESWTPKTKELLALFVERDAFNPSTKKPIVLKKYLLVQAPKEVKNTELSDSDFSQFKKDFKENQSALETTEKNEEDNGEDDEDKTNQDPKNSLTEFKNPKRLETGTFPLGFFHETDNSIGSVVIIKQIIGGVGEKAPYFTAVANNILFLKGKLFYLNVLREYHSQSDSDWVKIMSEHWVNTTIQSNKEKEIVKPKPTQKKEKKSVRKEVKQKSADDIKIYFRNGRSIVCEKVWRDGKTVYVIGKGKKYAVGYSESEIDLEKSFGKK